MRYDRPLVMLAAGLLPFSALHAQTLTLQNSIPPIGMVHSSVQYLDVNQAPLSTTGTGNVWDCTGLTATPLTTTTTYATNGASPFAAMYPSTTICAHIVVAGGGEEWRHFVAGPSQLELLGSDAEPYVGGWTFCEFPFDLGDSFTDTYTFQGNPFVREYEYVASGTIQAPWGIIPNVIMVQGGPDAYSFIEAGNVLEELGLYAQGTLILSRVDIAEGVDMLGQPAIGLWPNPARDRVRVALPFAGATITVCDVIGRPVVRVASTSNEADLYLNKLAPGVHVVHAVGPDQRSAIARLVVQ